MTIQSREKAVSELPSPDGPLLATAVVLWALHYGQLCVLFLCEVAADNGMNFAVLVQDLTQTDLFSADHCSVKVSQYLCNERF